MKRIPKHTHIAQPSITSCSHYVRHLVDRGGPQPEEFEALNEWFIFMHGLVRNGSVTASQLQGLWDRLGEPFSPQTLQGLVRAQLHGYAGDYEVIDRIYLNWVSPETHLAQWDHFFHWQKATKAVRNRKDYFINFIREFEAAKSTNDNLMILNIGSGPGRDIQEYFWRYPGSRWMFDCLDTDPAAVTYAQSLCRDQQDRVKFQCGSVLRFRLYEKYNLIWAGGLFDYFNDRTFMFMIKRLMAMLAPKGELVIGNFSLENPSREYMECGNWFLHHRSEDQLMSLASECNIPHRHLRIEREPEGVNLFLHIAP
jgi:SAM-dependent methyltransferase